MANIKEKQFRYFLYSQSQHKMCDNIENKIGREYIPGTIIINGQKKLFTEITKTSKSKYSDTIIVASGYLDDLNYKLPTRSWRMK